ncbi:MAG: ABC transporter permease [Clostridia bacterium]|nr:ABC transporter permease [Clostridia bacterium]
MKTNEKRIREPLFHVVKRPSIPLWKSMSIRLGAIIIAFLFSTLLASLLLGRSPIQFISTFFNGAIGTPRKIWNLAKDGAKLLCISLAVTPAFRMKFWNIGAEGQTLIGALAAVAVIFYLGGKVSNGVLLVLMFFAALIIGAIWGGIPAIFKAKWQTNETLFTLMMNYVAIGLVEYFLKIWVTSGSGTLGEMKFGHLPMVGHKYLLLIVCALIIAVLLYIYLNYTKQGYEISVVGESENTAKYIGINVGKVVIRTMIISGALCGIAGFLIVGALDHSVTAETVGGMGFTAIMVSWLAKFNPLTMIGSSLFIIFLQNGAAEISNMFRIDSSFPNMVVGIVLFFIIGCEFFINYKLKFRESAKKGEKA